MDGQTDRRKIYPFYRTMSPIGAAALLPQCKPKKCHFKIKVKQGKGTADYLMPLGFFFVANLAFFENQSQAVAPALSGQWFPLPH